MHAFLELLRVWVEYVITSLGYTGIGLVLFLEAFFPPIPGEFVLPFAGFLVGRGELLLVGVLLAGTGCSLLGTLVVYWLGRRVGEARVRAFIRSYGWLLLVDQDDLDRVNSLYKRYGGLVLCVGRALPLVRCVVALPAGIERMPLSRFVLYSSLGSFLWTATLCFCGLLLGSRWSAILSLIDRYEYTTLVLLALLVSACIAVRIRRRARRGQT